MRWGLIGASNIAKAHMIGALRSVPGDSIGWVQSGSLAHGQAFATAAGIDRATVSVAEVLADPAIGAVYISSTNEKHRDQALAALAAGKHVLCEKPLAMSVPDAVAMVAAAKAAGRVFATNHHLRCSGSHRAIRALIAQGRIGQVLSMRIHHAVHLPPFLQGWRIDAPDAGGGVIADITVHDADTARFLLGEDPVSVVASASSSGMGQGVEDSAMSVWTMASGAMVFAHESFTHRFAGTGLEVHGTEGSIFARGMMTQHPVGDVDLVTAAGREAVPYASHDLYAQAAADFAAAVAGKGRPAADGVDGVKSLAVAMAVKEAAATGHRVVVNYGGIVMGKLVSAAEAVARIKDGAVVTVSSSSALGCPDKVLEALGARFRAEGHPRGITTLHPIAAGDMYGVKGVDHIAQDGLLARVIGGSYPSGSSNLPMPEIWKMVTEDRIPAYNVPSGILFDMHRDVAARKAGVLTKVGLQTFVDPVREGCAMNAKAAAAPIVHRVEFGGETWLHFPNIIPDVCILRATTADERGNLTYEHEGATLGGLDQAIAVRNHGGLVIAQVKRMTAAGSLRPHDVRVPGHLVDLVVLDPDQKQTTETPYDPAISGEVMRPWSSFHLAEHGVEKVIARRAALELRRGMTANLGFGISAMVPRVLLEAGEPQAVTWAIEQGAVGGMPLTGFAFGCASNADAFMPSPNQFTYFQGAGFDMTFLSFMEVDVEGNVNVSKLGKKPYLTAGCGGFVDITAHARKIVFSGWFEAGAEIALDATGLRVAKPGKFTKMVDKVEHVTFSGNRAREQGQEVLYVTERCVIRLGAAGLVATEIMPGIDAARDIVAASHGRVQLAENARVMPLSLLAEGRMELAL